MAAVPDEVVAAATEEEDVGVTQVITIGVYPDAETTPFVTMLVDLWVSAGESSALPEDVDT